MEMKIKEARERAGYTQTELAAKIGVAPNTFCGYENGLHDPKSKLLRKIASECGTSIDFILGLTEDPSSPRTRIENASAPEGTEADDYEAILAGLTDMLQRMGWIREDGDITLEDKRFLLAVASMLDTYFEEHR